MQTAPGAPAEDLVPEGRLARLHTGDARRRLLDAALRAPLGADPSSPSTVVPECSEEALESAGPFGVLSSEIVGSIFATLLRFRRDPRSGARLHKFALNAAEDVLGLACSCRFLLWVFRSACTPLRLEVVGRCCTSVTPARSRRDGEAQPYYNQVMREERSRFHLRVFEGAVNALVCHCTGEHCQGARRAHNLIIGAPSRARSGATQRAVGEQRPRVKVMWRLRSRRLAAAGEGSAAALVLETEEVAGGGASIREAAVAALAAQMRRPPSLFGPAGYLSGQLSGRGTHDGEALERAVSGVLVVEDAPRSEATAHFEARPTHAVTLHSSPASARWDMLSVTQLRMSPCGDWLVTVASTLALPNNDAHDTAGRSEVRVFSLRQCAGSLSNVGTALDADFGGLASDLHRLHDLDLRCEGHSHIDAWFLRGGMELAVLDCSDARRGINVRPVQDDHVGERGFARKPVLHRYTRFPESPARPHDASTFRHLETVTAFARIRGWRTVLCDHSVVDSAVSSSGTGVVAIWAWQYSENPSGYGFNVQHYDLAAREWETVVRSKTPSYGGAGEVMGGYTPRRCALTPHSDTAVLLMHMSTSQAVRIDIYSRSPRSAKGYIGSEEGDIKADGCLSRDFGPPFLCVRTLAISSSIQMPVSFRPSGCSATVSPCGRFVVFVFKSPSTHANSSGGLYVLDLGEEPFARSLSTVWIPALSYALPKTIAWSRAGMWLQTHTGVLLVGTQL